MKTYQDALLAPYTSLNVGGVAETLLLPGSYDEYLTALRQHPEAHILGFGCNALISDAGLPGVTIMMRSGGIESNGTTLVADAGLWWDDLVQQSITQNLWGLELLSQVPSSVGGAVYGNIACYGQQISDTLAWVEVFDRRSGTNYRLPASDIPMGYRTGDLQNRPELVILRAAFDLSVSKKQELVYDSALVLADELGLDRDNLTDRRDIIIETRRRAGSIYSFDDPSVEHSAGSFFKNPLVSTEQATELARYDESGKTLERIQQQSQVHGGDTHRASAAHVLLAAGFRRGQAWGPVQLHDNHVLKIVTRDGATATQVYDVAQEILATVRQKLGIELEPEVKFIGKF